MLESRDWQGVLGAVARLHAHRDAATFPEIVAREMLGLIGGHQAAWNELALSVPAARVVSDPRIANHEHLVRTFERHMHEHPAVRAWFDGEASGVQVLSDYLTQRDYHATDLYQQLYRALGWEEQIALPLTPAHGHALAVVVGRDQRGVSVRDRRIAEVIGPHVLVAWRNLEALDRAKSLEEKGVPGDSGTARCLVELDDRGRPASIPECAMRWLRAYFLDCRGCDLPLSIRAWMSEQGGYAAGGTPLVRRRGDRTLTLRYFSEPRHRRLLLLEERTLANGAGQLRRAGLTQREVEVLRVLESGRSNDEAAAVLAISPRTIKKHLDNIYRKLGVTNRTAAIARLRAGAP